MLVVFLLIGCSFFGIFPTKQSSTQTPSLGVNPALDSTELPVWAIAATNAVITPGDNLTMTQPVSAPAAATETFFPDITLSVLPAWTPTSGIPIPTETNQPTSENATGEPTQQTSPAKPYPIFGMQLSLLTPAEGVTESALAGVYWVQAAAVSWQQVEPNEGERNWAALSGREQEWLNAASLGLTPIVTIHFTPAWAQKESGYSCGPIRKDKFAAFGNFLYDMVTRYSQPPYNIKYWQIWNEADAGLGITAADSPWGCWGDVNDQKYYGGDYFGKMLKSIYPRIKEANPQAQVLIGGLLLDCDPFQPPETPRGSGNFKDCSNSRFLEGILSTGAGDYFDGISFHSYDYYQGELGKYSNENWNSSWDKNGVVLTAKSSFIKNLLSQYGVRDKSLFNTESGVICGKTGEESVCTDNNFIQTKAYYVVEAYAAALAEQLDGNLWFSLKGWRASGLLDASMQPVPAYNAYRFASQQLHNHVFKEYLTDYAGVKGLAFQGDGQRIWILWSQDGNAHPIQLSAMPSAIYNIYGEAQPLGTQITISQAPMYFVWQP